MIVTVLPIYETDFRPEPGLAKIMNDRLAKAAETLKERLRGLSGEGSPDDDVIVYLSYTTKFTVRWRVVNDVPQAVEQFVARQCGLLGFIGWKISGVNMFYSRS